MALRLLIIGLLFSIGHVSSQCARCKNRDNGYVQTIDFIRQFHLADSFDSVPGSVLTQQAYRLTEESIISGESRQIFTVIPTNFWFESTFRSLQQKFRPWYLIHVTDAQGITQISITLDASQQVIGIGLPDISGNVQRVYFQHSNIFDQNWHKLLVSVNKDRVKVWIDCQQVLGLRGGFEELLVPRKKFDTSNGYTYVARYVDEPNQHQYQIFLNISSHFCSIKWSSIQSISVYTQIRRLSHSFVRSLFRLLVSPPTMDYITYLPYSVNPARKEENERTTTGDVIQQLKPTTKKH